MASDLNLLQKIIKFQGEIDNVGKEIEKKEFFSHIGDVMIVIQGNRKIVDIKITSDEILKNRELLQENILLACNDALDKIDLVFRQMVNKITGGVNF